MTHKRRFIRYLPAYAEMEEWRARVLDAGFTNVLPGVGYPAPGHPEDHDFSWESGRRLSAYTFIYITSGAGVFESVYYFSSLFKSRNGKPPSAMHKPSKDANG